MCIVYNEHIVHEFKIGASRSRDLLLHIDTVRTRLLYVFNSGVPNQAEFPKGEFLSFMVELGAQIGRLKPLGY